MMWKKYWLISALLAVAMVCGKPARAAENDDVLASKVFAIFKEKCFSCHSPQAKMDDALAKKGMKHLDYIDDLSKLRANPKLVVPGDPDKSLVYKQLIENEMPPDMSEVTPLTDA